MNFAFLQAMLGMKLCFMLVKETSFCKIYGDRPVQVKDLLSEC